MLLTKLKPSPLLFSQLQGCTGNNLVMSRFVLSIDNLYTYLTKDEHVTVPVCMTTRSSFKISCTLGSVHNDLNPE